MPFARNRNPNKGNSSMSSADMLNATLAHTILRRATVPLSSNECALRAFPSIDPRRMNCSGAIRAHFIYPPIVCVCACVRVVYLLPIAAKHSTVITVDVTERTDKETVELLRCVLSVAYTERTRSASQSSQLSHASETGASGIGFSAAPESCSQGVGTAAALRRNNNKMRKD